MNAPLYNILGYNFIYRNRKANSRGGVAMYIRNDIKYVLRPDLEVNIDTEFESIFIEAKINNDTVIVGEVYRIPNTSEILSIERYEQITTKLVNVPHHIILGTDQNFDFLKVEKKNIP